MPPNDAGDRHVPFQSAFLARLDAAVEPTGIPAYARGNPKRRHLRWLPLPMLLLAIGAMGTALVRPPLAEAASQWIIFAWPLAAFLPLFGPIRAPGTAERLDEYDRALRHRAYFFGYAGVSFAAMACLTLISVSTLLHPVTATTLVAQLRTLTFFLLTLFFTLPILHASWTTRPITED